MHPCPSSCLIHFGASSLWANNVLKAYHGVWLAVLCSMCHLSGYACPSMFFVKCVSLALLLALSPYCLCCSGFAYIHWLACSVAVSLFTCSYIHSLPTYGVIVQSKPMTFSLFLIPAISAFVSSPSSVFLCLHADLCRFLTVPTVVWSVIAPASPHLCCFAFFISRVKFAASYVVLLHINYRLHCAWFSGICLCWAATPLFFLMSLLLPIAAATAALRLSAKSVAKLQQQHSRALQVAFQRATVALNSRRQLRSLNGEAVEAKAFDMAVRRPAWCFCLCCFSCSLLLFVAAYILFMLACLRHRPFHPV